MKKSETVQKIEELAKEILYQIEKGDNPHIVIPIRSLSNTWYDEDSRIIRMGDKKQKRYFFNMAHAKKFMQTLLVAAECKELINSGKTTSIRDLFYSLKRPVAESKNDHVFEDQSESDPIIEDIEVTIDALREDLHLFANSKGSLVGNITLVDSGDTIDARRMGSGGWAVPSIVEPDIIEFKDVDAEFVLFIEKDAVWRRFNEDKFWKKHKCIITHGQGMPARGNRRLLHRLNKELGLPVYCLVDNDPWGLYIYSTIKQGSINLAHESKRMAVPDARFIGLSSFDEEKFKIPKSVRFPLKKVDVKRCKEMLRYEWFKDKKWQVEIKKMMDNNFKLELEALSRRGITFITEKYLPTKLEQGDWLD